jgi:hypothetical protein
MDISIKIEQKLRELPKEPADLGIVAMESGRCAVRSDAELGMRRLSVYFLF